MAEPEAVQFDYRSLIRGLPDQPGVYRMLDRQGAVLYVGKAKSLKKRVSSYFLKTLASPRIALMVAQVVGIETTVTRSEAEALLLENNLIKRLLPPFNIVFRDDKSYPYVSISRHKYPRLAFYRGTPDRNADYYGPYPSAQSVRSNLALLQKMFRLRTCDDSVFGNRSRACLLYQIGRCSGPCVGHIGLPEYEADVACASMFLSGRGHEVVTRLQARMEFAAERLAFEEAALYRDQIASLTRLRDRQVVTGTRIEEADIVVGMRVDGILCINIAMVRAGEHLGDRPLFPQHAEHWPPDDAVGSFLLQHYAAHPLPERIICNTALPTDVVEDLAALKEKPASELRIGLPRGELQRAWVEMAEKNASIACQARGAASGVRAASLEDLREALALDEIPRRIECFDISHTQGEMPVASCVVCIDGEMHSSEYRRFNINGDACGNDLASIAQAVRRRYEKIVSDPDAGPTRIPELLIIDGGGAQVSVSSAVLAELGLRDQITLIGVAKGEGRREGLEKIVFDANRSPMMVSLDRLGFRLILEVRNEAHRFALSGHRTRRAKPRKRSSLDDVPGIGPRRRRGLLAHFGSLGGVRDATVEQLAAVNGISRRLAESIYKALR